MVDRINYVQGVVQTRLLEKELLTNIILEQLIEAANTKDLWRILKTTHYAELLQERHYTDEHFEQFLNDALQLEYERMNEISLDKQYIQFLQLKYDYFNLKVLCKEQLLNEDLSHLYLPLGTITPEQLTLAYGDGSLKEVNERFARAINRALAHYEENRDPQWIEILLDRFYMERLYTLAEQFNLPLFEQYVGAKIDFVNVKTMLRVRKQERDNKFLEDVLLKHGDIEQEKILYSLHDPPTELMRKYEHERIGPYLLEGLEAYEQHSQLTVLEKVMDNYLLAIIDDAKYIHFGPEPLMAYIIKKEAEIKNLRLIFISKLNNVSVKKINERMRSIHV